MEEDVVKVDLKDELAQVIMETIEQSKEITPDSDNWNDVHSAIDKHMEEFRKMQKDCDDWSISAQRSQLEQDRLDFEKERNAAEKGDREKESNRRNKEFFIKTGLYVVGLATSIWSVVYSYQVEHKSIINHKDSANQAKQNLRNRNEQFMRMN